MIGVTGRKRVSSGMLYYFKQCNEVYAARGTRSQDRFLRLASVRRVLWKVINGSV